MKRALTPALLLAFVAGALVQARWVNVDARTHDQLAYLAQARLLAETHFEAPTNRIEMPAFPAILSLFYRDGLTDDAWFWRAKLVSIGVASLVAIAMAITLRRVLPASSARFATIAIVFFVLMFRAAYVQTEPLYYLLALWALLAIDALWRAPTFLRALVTGALFGLAWLTKASILVAGIVTLPLFVSREVVLGIRRRTWALLGARLAIAGAAVLAFVAVIAPYIKTTRELQGRWLYNMSPAYVMWCDSWEDFIDHMRRLGPVEGWRSLPDQSDVPSMRHYLASHSIGQIASRTASGSVLVLLNLLASPFGPLLLATAMLAALFVARPAVRKRMSWRRLDSSVWFVVYFVVHATLQGFYAPIAAGARFSLALAVPAFVFLLRTMSRHTTGEDRITLFGRHLSWSRGERALERVAWVLLVVAVPFAAATLYCGG